jgi:hypothetical protein
MREILEGKHIEDPDTLERVTCCKSFETASRRCTHANLHSILVYKNQTPLKHDRMWGTGKAVNTRF